MNVDNERLAWHARAKSRAIFHVIPEKENLLTVEMIAASGKRCLIPDFRTKAEADAWVVQTERMLHEHGPLHRVVRRLGGQH